MSVDAASPARWLAGVPIETSRTLFFLGENVAAVRDLLDQRGWDGRLVDLQPPHFAGIDALTSPLVPDAETPLIVMEPEVVRQNRDAARRAAGEIGRAWFGARANEHARREQSGRYLLNTLRNLRAIEGSADAGALDGALAGVPAVVIAAGPSLDRNLAALVRIRDRSVVIAVDTALRPLLAAGIEPDLVVALDPSEANANHLCELPACPNTHLVAEGSLDPEALAGFAGRTFVFRVADHQPWPWFRDNGCERRQLRAWGSVLTTAFDLALEMQCDPIVFAGADLAFTDGQPYARNTTFEEDWLRAESWGVSITESWSNRIAGWPEVSEPGVGGQAVRTAPHLLSFRDWIVKAALASGRRIVNASGSGVLIGGAIEQNSLDSEFASRPPLRARPADVVAHAKQHAVPPPKLEAGSITADVRAAWKRFASVSDADIDRALAPAPAGPLAIATVAAVESQPHEPDRDAAFLAALRDERAVETIRYTSVDQDLSSQISAAAARMFPSGAVVIIDELDTSVGAAVRRTVDGLLLDRQDIWVETRRFADHQSRLTVLRGDAALHTRPPHQADALKRQSVHQAAAFRISSVIVKQLAPASVVDLGCGTGEWLTALSSSGVQDLTGVSATEMSLADWRPDGRRFDLCLCLEVAQEYGPDAHGSIVATCAAASDVVVFSSAPPGVPGSSPHHRPLSYWSRLFWRHGYVLDDCLRPLLESHADAPVNVFDLLVVFRRVLGGDAIANPVLQRSMLALADRVYDLQMQQAWWLTLAHDRAQLLAQQTGEAPRGRCTAWPIPATRMEGNSGSGVRTFRFRSEASRWFVTHPGASLRVLEDGTPLTGWTRCRDEITFRSSDGSDPRTNGRHYSLEVPRHVAWVEGQPLLEVLKNRW